MIESKEAIQRPVLMLSGLALASVALLVSNLADAWDKPPLRDIFTQSALYLFSVGAAGAIMELMLRARSAAIAEKAEEAGQPVDAKSRQDFRRKENIAALAMIVAILFAPAFGVQRTKMLEEKRIERAKAEHDRKAALSEDKTRKAE